MCVLRLAVLVLFVSASVGFAAQQPSASQSAQTPQSDPQAMQTAAQSLKAQGVTGLVPPIRARGQIHSPEYENDGTFELVALGPRTFLTTIVRDSEQYTYLINDGAGAVTDRGKKRYISSAHLLGERCAYLPILSFLGELSNPGISLGPVSTGSLGGNATYILTTTFTDSSDPQRTLLNKSEIEIDARTLLPLRMRTQMHNDFNPDIVSDLEYSYSDYRQEGPYLLPHTITLTNDGNLHSVVTLQSIEVNPPVAAADLVVR